MMKNVCWAGIGAALLLGGCATVDPMTVEQTGKDLQSYTETLEITPKDGQFKIASVSKVLQHESAKVKKDGKKSDEMKVDEKLAAAADSAICNALAGLGKFDVVDRKNGVILSAEGLLQGESQSPAGADLLLVSESRVVYIAKQGWKRTSYADKARGVQVATNFRLIDIATKETVVSKTITSKSVSNEKKNVAADVERACQMNALKFARLIAARYLPAVKVRQTRGNGRYALVGMGQNFQAVPAVKSWQWWPYKYFPLMYLKLTEVDATKIDFFANEKIVEAGKEKIVPNVIGRGEVIRSDKNTAWVEVVDYEKVNVLKGHNAKVSEDVDEIPLGD